MKYCSLLILLNIMFSTAYASVLDSNYSCMGSNDLIYNFDFSKNYVLNITNKLETERRQVEFRGVAKHRLSEDFLVVSITDGSSNGLAWLYFNLDGTFKDGVIHDTDYAEVPVKLNCQRTPRQEDAPALNLNNRSPRISSETAKLIAEAYIYGLLSGDISLETSYALIESKKDFYYYSVTNSEQDCMLFVVLDFQGKILTRKAGLATSTEWSCTSLGDYHD